MKYILADKHGEDLVKTMDMIYDPIPFGLKEYYGNSKHTLNRAENENVTEMMLAVNFYWECVCIDAIANYRSDMELVAKTHLVYEQLTDDLGELACDLLTQIATERLEPFEERVIVRYFLNDDVEIVRPS